MKFALALALLLVHCASKPVLPEKESVKVSREKAKADCREIGKVRGATGKIKGTAEEVLEDMKQEAANKGANYVVVGEYSDNHTAVTGMAYDCP